MRREVFSYNVTWRFTDSSVQEYIDFEYRRDFGDRLRCSFLRQYFEHSCYFVKLRFLWPESSLVRHSAITARCSALSDPNLGRWWKPTVSYVQGRLDEIEFVKSSNHSSKNHRFIIETSFDVWTLLPSGLRSNNRQSNAVCLSAYICLFRTVILKKRKRNPKRGTHNLVTRRDIISFPLTN